MAKGVSSASVDVVAAVVGGVDSFGSCGAVGE